MSEVREFPDVAGIETSIELLSKDLELKQDIFNMLCSNWSPSRISKHLFRAKGIKLTPTAINTFLKEIPPAFVLPPSFIKKKLLLLDITIDSIDELGRLLKIQEERVAAALLLEDLSPGGSGKGITIEATRLIKEYEKSLLAYTELMQSLGEIPEEPVKVDLTSGGETFPTLRQLIEARKSGT